MRFRGWFGNVAMVMLLYFSIEILLRRWVWDQVPTQISAFWVYAVLLMNGLVIARILSLRVRN